MRKIISFALITALLATQLWSKPIIEKRAHVPLPKNTNWTYQATLSQKIANSGEGNSVALSGDGATLAVMGDSAQIYHRSGSSWIHETTLTQSGSVVALSKDGKTLAIGDPDFNNSGAIFLYYKFDSAWRYWTMLTQGIENAYEGYSIALSDSGDVLLAGLPGSNNGAGSLAVYQIANQTWFHFATFSQGVPNAQEGLAVALSSNFQTIAAGSPSFNMSAGATQIYTKYYFTWRYNTTLTQAIPNAKEGRALSLSADGNLLAVGSPHCWSNSVAYTGITYIYQNQAGNWRYQAGLSLQEPYSYEGTAVALSADGTTLMAGAPQLGTPFEPWTIGGTQVYVRSSDAWWHLTTLTQKKGGDEGFSVALSNTTFAAGAPTLWENTGATQIYTAS